MPTKIIASMICALTLASAVAQAEPAAALDHWSTAARLVKQMEVTIGKTLVLIEYSRAHKDFAERSFLYEQLEHMLGHVQAVRDLENNLLATGGPAAELSDENLAIIVAHADAVQAVAKRTFGHSNDNKLANAGRSVVAPDRPDPLTPPLDVPARPEIDQSLVNPWPSLIPPPTSPYQVSNE